MTGASELGPTIRMAVISGLFTIACGPGTDAAATGEVDAGEAETGDTSCGEGTDPVVFPDPQLDFVVRAHLGPPGTPYEGDIYESDLCDLTSLAGIGQNISDLAGLESCVALERLYLGFNHSISDLSPVVGLTNLRVLSASRNNISDVSPLVGLTNLRSLGLGLPPDVVRP